MSVVFIGGFDPSGGAGVSADLRIAQAIGVSSLSVISCLALQDGKSGLKNIPVPLDILKDQLDFALSSAGVTYAKVGAIPNAEVASVIFEKLEEKGVRMILDTPLFSTSGLRLAEEDYLDFLRKNAPRCFLVTPNLEEYNTIGGDALKSARVLVKSAFGVEESCDALYLEGRLSAKFCLPKLETSGRNIRGTGCSFAAAIACFLSVNQTLKMAITSAKKMIHEEMRRALLTDGDVKILKF